ncbi:heavy metal transporter [Muricauda sp. JGD-17]|uniref:Heavy metal transporter n=1 Tax=Flagellimonas ochracea TaxID=2696472 RepID=A0A964TD68_9FLAO|nr:heavy metal-associated domain-containing protein [Allomuricauda ochracea]NAY92715.1 heavy metal transporter [Allomuricauda ochracea]
MMATIEIQNLNCGGCANSIKKNLEKLEGVSKIQVNVEKSEVMFEPASELHVEKAKESLKGLGYPAIDDANSISSKARSYMSCATGRLLQH